MSTPSRGPDFDALAAFDPEIAGVVVGELDRLRGGLQPIASENFGTAIHDADGSRAPEVRAAVRELVSAHPAYPDPQRAAG